jgi:pimeloyl-ACP methyl ester carboxylesterase
MGKISVGRVIGGGLLAGLVINIFEFLVNGLWLAADWEAVMRALGKGPASGPLQTTIFIVWGFIMGVFAVWLYAAMRPRFGAGPKTACIAALATWFSGYVLAMVPPAIMDMFPARLMAIGIAVGLVEIVLGTQLGAYIYKEEGSA